MEHNNLIPDDIKRFILRSIDSVPHLEAILLFYREPQNVWDSKMMAQNLYITEKKASRILTDLLSGGFIIPTQDESLVFQYHPQSLELESLIERLSVIYSNSLIEVTNFIHSNISKQAQSFGDAFKWQDEKDK